VRETNAFNSRHTQDVKVPRETAPEVQLVVLMQIKSSGAAIFNARPLKTHLKH
jgi:hypothetical protein